MLLLGAGSGTAASISAAASMAAAAAGGGQGAARAAPGASGSPVPALQLSNLRLLQGSQASPKQLSAGSQGPQQGQSARSDGGVPRSISGVSGLSLQLSAVAGSLPSATSSSRSRGGSGAPLLSEWLQPLVALVEPPASVAAAHLERPPASYERLQLQLQVGGTRCTLLCKCPCCEHLQPALLCTRCFGPQAAHAGLP